jgi:hypothetical protein
MAVRKQCKAKGCKASPRCDHPWWFDVMHQGKRYRMPVDAFALLRGAMQPVSSLGGIRASHRRPPLQRG